MKYLVSLLLIFIPYMSFASNTTITINGTNYNMSYSNTTELTSIKILENNLQTLDLIFNANWLQKEYSFSGTSLSNYALSTKIKHVSVNGVDIADVFGKYWIRIQDYLQKVSTDNIEWWKYVDLLMVRILWSNYTTNKSWLQTLTTSLWNNLYSYKLKTDSYIISTPTVSDGFKRQVYSVFKNDFSNKINSFKKEYSESLNVMSNLDDYLSGAELCTSSWELVILKSQRLQLIQDRYTSTTQIITQKLSSNEIFVVNSFSWADVEIRNVIQNAINDSQLWFPYLLNSLTINQLNDELIDLKTSIISKIDNEYDTALNEIIKPNQETITDWILSQSWKLVISWKKEVTSSVWDLTNQFYDTFSAILEGQYQNSSQELKDIYAFSSSNVDKKSNIEYLWMFLVKNLNLMEQKAWLFTIPWFAWVKLVDLIKWPIKDIYMGLWVNDTIKDISQSLQTISLSDSKISILTGYTKNFIIKNFNNPNVSNSILPLAIDTLDLTTFKSSISWNETIYFWGYNKANYSLTSSVWSW